MEKAGRYASLKMGVPPAPSGKPANGTLKGNGEATTQADLMHIMQRFNGIGG